MAIRKRFEPAQRKPKPEYVTRPDCSNWTNDELAMWLEGRAYELESKGNVEASWSRKLERDAYMLSARRLRGVPATTVPTEPT